MSGSAAAGAAEETVVRPARAGDAAAIAELYNYYVLNTVVTFEEAPVAAEALAARMRDVERRGLPWLVAEAGGAVVGYAYATPWKERSAYRFAVEVTVYVAPGLGGRGLGTRLYQALFAALRPLGVHAVIGGIALPNDASIALHETMGMRKVAEFREVGWKLGRWVDVGYWELVL